MHREEIRIQENGRGEMEGGPYYGLSSSDLQCVERSCSALGFHEISLIPYKNSSLFQLSLGSFCFMQPKKFLIRLWKHV